MKLKKELVVSTVKGHIELNQYFFILKMLSAVYICCFYSNALQNAFAMEANTINPDQTAPKGAV